MAIATVKTVICAPRATVYDVFADKEKYSRFLPLKTTLVTAGQQDRQGVGALHKLRLGPIGITERITNAIPHEYISYEMVAGAPLRHHFGAIIFGDHPDGTAITYRMDSAPLIPVPDVVLTPVLVRLTGMLVRRAAREVQRRGAQR